MTHLDNVFISCRPDAGKNRIYVRRGLADGGIVVAPAGPDEAKEIRKASKTVRDMLNPNKKK